MGNKNSLLRSIVIFILSMTLSLITVLSNAQTAGGGSSPAESAGGVDCQDANLMSGKLITNICWSCVFPIKIAGVNISGSSHAPEPSDSSNQRFCMCHDPLGVPEPGVVTQLWEPSHVLEFQRTPGCMSTLAGIRLPFDKTNRGKTGANSAAERRHELLGYRHYHMYAFPIMLMIDIYVPKRCNAGGFSDLDVMFMSEVDPTWNHDELSFFVHFENALVANPVATTACIADAVSSNVERPIDMLWWCADLGGIFIPYLEMLLGMRGFFNSQVNNLFAHWLLYIVVECFMER